MIEWRGKSHREHKFIISELINTFLHKQETGVEIGINEGQTSHHLLSNTGVHLYMIDPWKTWKGWSTQDQCDQDYVQVCSFEKEFPGRVTVFRNKSEDVADKVPDNLDFIFIDGNHDYEYIKKDLEMWVPKVRSNGLVMGHDWTGKYKGVINAVTEYFKQNDCILPPFKDYKNFNLEWKHTPAPHLDPVVNKSWPIGRVWWGIKK